MQAGPGASPWGWPVDAEIAGHGRAAGPIESLQCAPVTAARISTGERARPRGREWLEQRRYRA